MAGLWAAGVEVEYWELPRAGHDGPGWERAGPAALAFLARHLRPSD